MTTGLNGTPMPAFGDALKPEERWAITDYMYSLGDGDDPHYANLVTAKHVDDPIDLDQGRGRVREGPGRAGFRSSGRSWSPGASSTRLSSRCSCRRSTTRPTSRFCVRWNDMSAETTGSNSPPARRPHRGRRGAQKRPRPLGPVPARWTSGASRVAAAAPHGRRGTRRDVLGRRRDPAPLQLPTGPRKPYFLFGDATNGVDVWFADLARSSADQFTAKGSAAISDPGRRRRSTQPRTTTEANGRSSSSAA